MMQHVRKDGQLLLLDQPLVQARRFAVIQQIINRLQHERVRMRQIDGMIPHLQAFHAAVLHERQPLFLLLRHGRNRKRRRGGGGRNLAEIPMDGFDDAGGLHVADNNQRGVVRRVMRRVIREHVVARNALNVLLPADDGMMIRVRRGKNRGFQSHRQLSPGRIKLLFEFFENHGAFGLEFIRIEEAMPHAIRLDL